MKPQRPRTLLRVVPCLLLAATLLIACGQDAATPDAVLLCDDIAVLEETLIAFRNLTPATASIDDYRDAWDAVQEAYEVVVIDRAALAEANVDRLEQAHDDLRDAVEDLPEDLTAPDAVADLEPAIEELRAARDEVAGDLECVDPEV
jgi:SepF-like predicted cell division protein (DUF552 family)